MHGAKGAGPIRALWRLKRAMGPRARDKPRAPGICRFRHRPHRGGDDGESLVRSFPGLGAGRCRLRFRRALRANLGDRLALARCGEAGHGVCKLALGVSRIERRRRSGLLCPCHGSNRRFDLRHEVDLLLPSNGRPVTSWPTHDDAFADVVQGLRILLDHEAAGARGRTQENPRVAHLPWASGGWAWSRRRAKDRTPRCPRRGTFRTGATPRSPGVITS